MVRYTYFLELVKTLHVRFHADFLDSDHRIGTFDR